jgi:hypothetical protein
MNKALSQRIAHFPWGKIVHVHTIGDYTIVEYSDKLNPSRILFHPFVSTDDLNRSVQSLDAALIVAIAFKAEGGDRNSQAAHYFAKMIGLE